MAPDGLVLFDSNSLLPYLTDYEAGAEDEREQGGRRWKWTGLGRADTPAPIYRAQIEGDGIKPIINAERYFSIAKVEEAMRGARLERLAVLGMHEADGEVVLTEAINESRDVKIVYIAKPTS